MRISPRTLSISVAALALALAACGGSGGVAGGASVTPGAGSISITSFSPSTLLGCAPTPFTITGTNFQDVTGTTAIVKFTALSGAPFGGSAIAIVIATVTSGTTIAGITPVVTVCGIASISVRVDVTLESGVSTSSTGSGITISLAAPTVTSFAPASVPAAIPTAFSITGTGFTPGPVTVRFVSANLGDLNFQDGTSDSVDVAATATSSTTITGETPLARACTADFTSSVQIIEPDGCCTAPTLPTFLTWIAPTLSALAYGSISAVVPTAIGVQGANLGVDGEIGTVRLTQSSPTALGLLFNNFGSRTIDLPGVIAGGGTLALILTPPVSACVSPGFVLPTLSASMHWVAPRGSSCADHPAGATATTFLVPPITGISTPTVNALVATPFTLGFGFAVTNAATPVRLRFNSTSAGAIFADGTSTTFAADSDFTTVFTVGGTAPTATLCGVDTATASITVFFAGGSCITSAPDLITYQAPALTAASPGGISNANVPAALFPNNNLFGLDGDDPFLITAAPGRSFGTVGSFVEVRFAATVATNTVFQGGTQSYDTVVGRVESATTISGEAPATTLAIAAAAMAATAQVFFEDGSCTLTTPCVFDGTSDRTFATGAGGLFSIAQNGTGAPSLIAGGTVLGTNASVDARRNRLVTRDILLYDTAPTMNATPAVPSSFGPGLTAVSPVDIVFAPDRRLGWVTIGAADALASFHEDTRLFAGGATLTVIVTPAGSNPSRILYNQPAGELVVAYLGTKQIALLDASTGVVDALFSIPAQSNGGVGPWNGVMALRPGAGSARTYQVYDDPVAANIDWIGSLALSTGAFTIITTGVNQASATSPSALAYDARRDQLIWWHPTPATIERRNITTLVAIASAALGTNVTSISDDLVDDRYYATDFGAGTVIAVNGSTLASVGTVPVASAATLDGSFNASTSP